MKEAIAIIPARSGSKRIPGKNTKVFSGKPIIQYPLEASFKSNLFEKIVISTDDESLSKSCANFDVEINSQRPANLADDHATLSDVLFYELSKLKDEGRLSVKYVCLILATTPFLKSSDLCASFEVLKGQNSPSVIPVVSLGRSVFRSFKINQTGKLELFFPEYEFVRSNDLPEAFQDAGQFYWLNIGAFLQSKRIFSVGAVPYPLSSWTAVDIDTQEDWERAERLFLSCLQTSGFEN